MFQVTDLLRDSQDRNADESNFTATVLSTMLEMGFEGYRRSLYYRGKRNNATLSHSQRSTEISHTHSHTHTHTHTHTVSVAATSLMSSHQQRNTMLSLGETFFSVKKKESNSFPETHFSYN